LTWRRAARWQIRKYAAEESDRGESAARLAVLVAKEEVSNGRASVATANPKLPGLHLAADVNARNFTIAQISGGDKVPPMFVCAKTYARAARDLSSRSALVWNGCFAVHGDTLAQRQGMKGSLIKSSNVRTYFSAL